MLPLVNSIIFSVELLGALRENHPFTTILHLHYVKYTLPVPYKVAGEYVA